MTVSDVGYHPYPSLTSLIHPERMREKIEAAIRERNLQRHVFLPGEAPEPVLLAMLRRADLFVMPVRDLPGIAPRSRPPPRHG